MVVIPAGAFWMGNEAGRADERPRHRVHLDAYEIDVYEVTNARFAHMRIADIAYEAGFNDLSYFNRMFRRRFALAPGEVRAQLSWSADR